jgi:RHS repeat-associated protein
MNNNHLAKSYMVSRPLRLITWVVIITQLLAPYEGYLFAQPVRSSATPASTSSIVQQKSAAPKVVVNRTVPKVTPPSATPQFSENPTDEEIYHARVFEQPLLKMNGVASARENKDLAHALTAYIQRADRDDDSVIVAFLARYPHSPWRASLLSNMGKVYRYTGYFSKALDSWEEAWALAKDSTEPNGRTIANNSVGELAELTARLGRLDHLHEIFAWVKGRELTGPATEKLSRVAEACWVMEHDVPHAFKCGPYAVASLRALAGQNEQLDDAIKETHATPKGTSLTQIHTLANKLKMSLQMAKREPGAEVISPAVIHWKAGHFAAVLRERNGYYFIKDPTFTENIWVSKKAVDTEGSGYFLVPEGTLPRGWRSVDSKEGELVWGKGNSGIGDPAYVGAHQTKCKPCPQNKSDGMADYNIDAMLVSLSIMDTPVGYQPPRGPRIDFTVTYNQRDETDPSVFTLSNFGPKFSFNYSSCVYVVKPVENVTEIHITIPGGGTERCSAPPDDGVIYADGRQSHDSVQRNSAHYYSRTMPDGTKYVYDLEMDSAIYNRLFLSSKTDAQGNVMTYTYDAFFRLAAITDCLGQVTTIDYASTVSTNVLFYRISKVTDPFGRFATFEYEPSYPYHLSKITDVIGLTSQFGYGPGDFISTLTTPYGVTGFTNTETVVGGVTTSRVLEITDPLGNKERAEFQGYGVAGFPVSESLVPTNISTLNNYMQYRNTFFWDKKAMHDAPGDYTKAKIFHWLHDNGSAIASPILESEKSPLEARVWYNYNSQGSPISDAGIDCSLPTKVARVLDDGSTQLYQYFYGLFGKVYKSIDPNNRTTVYSYDLYGKDLLEVRQMVSLTNSELLNAFTYNSQHLPLTSRDASGKTNYFTYNAAGQITSVMNSLGQTATMDYDENGYLTNVVGTAPWMKTHFTYDGYGRVRTVTDSDGYTITTDYDKFDRPTKITYPDGTYEQIVYDRLDPILARDRRGHWSSKTYNALRQVTDVRDALNRVTHFEWCGCGAMESVTDPMGKVTTWLRDIESRPITKIYPDLTQVSCKYETNTSRIKYIVDAKEQTNSVTYFRDNNVKQISYSTNTGVTTPSVFFTYDTNYNRLLTMTDGIGTTTYSYYPVSNALGSGMLQSIDGPWDNDTITYQYDALGRVTNQAINGVSAIRSFDAVGRVTTYTNALGSFTNHYVANTMRPRSVAYPNGQGSSFSYFGTNNDLRLQTIWHTNSAGGTISKFDYTFDADGQIKTWTQQADTTSTNTYTFEYDSVDQLIGATLRTAGPGAALLKQFVYGYDKSGNRTSEQIDQGLSTANYNDANQLTNSSGGGSIRFQGSMNETGAVMVGGGSAMMTTATNFLAYATLPTGTSTVQVVGTDLSHNSTTNNYQIVVTNNGIAKTLRYDLNGNLTNLAAATYTNTYEWDAAHRFTAINVITASGTNRSEFTYDGLGRRVQILEKQNGTVVSIRKFLWVGMALCEERDATGTNVTKRFFGPGEQISGTNYFYTMDHLGSIREMTDATGAIRARYDYDPYGRRTKVSGDVDGDFAYTGHYFHQNSGLYLAPYRAYDADSGRWISRDPLSESGGLNLYAYVNGDPINATDPLGLLSSLYYLAGADAIDLAFLFGHATAITADAMALEKVLEALYDFGNAKNDCEANAALIDGALNTALAVLPLEEILASVLKPFVRPAGKVVKAIICFVTDGCFVEGTEVATDKGSKAIENIQPGDVVASYSQKEKKWEFRKVEETFVRDYEGDIITITVADQIIQATGNHPFWVVAGVSLSARPVVMELPQERRNSVDDGRWVEARSLKIGDVFLTIKGEQATVTACFTRQDHLKVYNFKVQGNHTYAVGNCGILVHNNDCFIPWSSRAVRLAAKELEAGAKEVRVASREEAEEIFRNVYQGDGYRNTTGMTGRQVRETIGKKWTYHWDMFDTMHGGQPHLQIHTGDGEIIRIFFP